MSILNDETILAMLANFSKTFPAPMIRDIVVTTIAKGSDILEFTAVDGKHLIMSPQTWVKGHDIFQGTPVIIDAESRRIIRDMMSKIQGEIDDSVITGSEEATNAN